MLFYLETALLLSPIHFQPQSACALRTYLAIAAIVRKVKWLSAKNPWQIFSDECKGVADAYQRLMREVGLLGELDDKTRLLILVGIFSATRDPVALRHFAQQAINAGASKKEIEAAALLAFSVGVSSAEMSIPAILDITRAKNL